MNYRLERTHSLQPSTHRAPVHSTTRSAYSKSNLFLRAIKFITPFIFKLNLSLSLGRLLNYKLALSYYKGTSGAIIRLGPYVASWKKVLIESRPVLHCPYGKRS